MGALGAIVRLLPVRRLVQKEPWRACIRAMENGTPEELAFAFPTEDAGSGTKNRCWWAADMGLF